MTDELDPLFVEHYIDGRYQTTEQSLIDLLQQAFERIHALEQEVAKLKESP